MSFFSRKKEVKEEDNKGELPELPKLPEFPAFSDLGFGKVKSGLPSLPSFPLSSMGMRISDEAVKQAVTEELEPFETSVSGLAEKPRVMEISDKKFEKPFTAMPEFKDYRREAEPVFVRIDKYKAALMNFNEVRKRLAEIESMLNNIKEIKAREDAELQEWETEIQEVKSKLDSIDKGVFSKLG